MGIKFVVNSPKEIMLIIIVEKFCALFFRTWRKKWNSENHQTDLYDL